MSWEWLDSEWGRFISHTMALGMCRSMKNIRINVCFEVFSSKLTDTFIDEHNKYK